MSLGIVYYMRGSQLTVGLRRRRKLPTCLMAEVPVT